MPHLAERRFAPAARRASSRPWFPRSPARPRALARRLSGQVWLAIPSVCVLPSNKQGFSALLGSAWHSSRDRGGKLVLSTLGRLARVEACLLGGGALGPGHSFQPPVRDRLAAVDREPVCPLLEALLGPLECLQLVAEPLDHRAIALDLEQLRAAVGGVLIEAGELAVSAI